GKPETLVGLDKHQAQLQLADGLKKVANPLEQARQCMIQVVNRLKQDPQMLFAEGSPFAGKICMPYGYGAVFTNITRKQIQSGVSDAERDLVLPDSKVIYKDEMTESADAETYLARFAAAQAVSILHKPMPLPRQQHFFWIFGAA